MPSRTVEAEQELQKEKRRNQESNQQNAARQAFLLKLSDALRPLANASEILFTASRVLGEHLGADRVGYAEDQANGETIIVTRNYTNGVPNIEGCYHYNNFGSGLLKSFRSGRTVMQDDIANDPSLTALEKEAHAELHIGATLDKPLMKAGRLIAVLFVHYREPHLWKGAEVALIDEVAERTWADVERAHAEKTLRKSEEKYRMLFDSIDEGFCIIELLYDDIGKANDWRFLQVNRAFERNNGICSAEGRTIGELVPGIEPKWIQIYDHVAQTGEPLRFEEDSAALGRVFSVYAFRIGQPVDHQVAVIFSDITQRKQSEQALRRAHDELEKRVQERNQELFHVLEQQNQSEAGRVELMKRIVKSQEEERARISRELHDSLGQHLTGLVLGLRVLEMQISRAMGEQHAQEIPQLSLLRAQVDELVQVAHNQARELRPAELDSLGLAAALRQYVSEWSRLTGVAADFQALGWNNRPPIEVETTLYRVVQEALTNSARHAQATQISVVLERKRHIATVIVEDNGQGFEFGQKTNRLGILGMCERLSIVSGTLEIETAPGKGTAIFARVPLNQSFLDSSAEAVT